MRSQWVFLPSVLSADELVAGDASALFEHPSLIDLLRELVRLPLTAAVAHS